MTNLQVFLQERAQDGLLLWSDQVKAMQRFSLSCTGVDETCLEIGILPARYQRNRQMISVAQQLQLLRSKVAVIGCGGLGGYVIEELARLGVGRIIAIDPDVFEEHNLNRQMLSSMSALGQTKVKAAAERVQQINPAVSLQPLQLSFSASNGCGLLKDADVVVDAVDNIPTRLELAELCSEIGKPLVHGAIAGWYGHVTTIFPGESTLQKIYHQWRAGAGVESDLGNPSFTPALVASFEVAEVCKILLGEGRLLRNCMLSINLLEMEVEEIPL
jgi:molybdopterin/thiamine biosynthesis adenylyltransferase